MKIKLGMPLPDDIVASGLRHIQITFYELTSTKMNGNKQTYNDLEKRIAQLEKELESYKKPEKNNLGTKRTENIATISANGQFRKHTELSPVAIYETDADGSCLYVNKKWKELSGLTLDEALGDGWINGIHTDDRKSIFDCWGKHAKSRNPWSMEYRFCTPEGKVSWVYGTTVVMINQSKEISGYLGINIDITRSKELELHEKRYKEFYQQTPAMLHSINKEGEIIEVSDRWLKELGYTRDEVIGKKSVEFLTNKSKKEAIEKRLPQLYKYGNINDVEFQFVKKDGRKIDIKLSAVIEKDNVGNHLASFAVLENITEKKRTEREIKETQTRHQKLFSYSPVSLWEEDFTELYNYLEYLKTTGITNFEKYFDDNPEEILKCSLMVTITDVNEATLKLHQAKDKDELLGNLDKIFTTKSLDTFKQEVIAIANGKKEFETEAEVKTLTGKLRNVLLKLNIHKKDDGKYQALLATTDISERKKTKDKLLESDERFRLAMKATKDGLYDWNLRTNEIYYSPGWKSMLGYEDHELKNEFKIWERLTDREDIKASWNMLNDLLEGKRDRFELEFKMKHKKGHWVSILSRANAIFDKSGKPYRVIGTHIDLTERITAEGKITLEKERANNIIEGTNAGTWDWNIQSNDLIINARWANILGYEVEELEPITNKTWEDNVHPDDLERVYNIIQKHFNQELDYYDAEFRMKHKNKSWIWINARGKVVERAEDGKALRMTGIHSDITNRKIVEKELVKAKEKAEESDRLKSAFMANMSHEIRTPMNGIIGFTDLLKEPNLSHNKHLRYVNVIQKSGQRMLNIINDLIDISKIEAGQMEIEISETNINEQLEYLYSFFKPEATQNNLYLSYKNELPKELAIIKTDREKLYAILTNLLKNAIKYTNEGSIEFGYKAKTTDIEFYVKDTGIGIANNHHKIVFERFAQADMSITKPYEGAGLGLSITKAYVELLGGRIWLESEYGVGSTFYFTLPIKKSETAVKYLAHDKETYKQLGSFKNLTILTAEDDEIASIYLYEVLKGRCKKLIQVSNGEEAVQICKSNKDIDLILMDVKMPDMDGHTATREIRKFNKEVIIISQTAYALSDDREKSIDAGCNDYISKPIKLKELDGLLKNYFKL